MTKLTDWLSSLPQVTGAEPVRVTIKGTTYEGARYTEQLTTPEGSEAYGRGERSYTRETIYLLGALPRHYLRSTHACYTLLGDAREWYIAGYWDGRPNPFNPGTEKEFHPFGPYFQLAPWQDPSGEKIDHFERKPYARIPLQIAS